MKKIFTLHLLLLICTGLWATPYKSRLTFSSLSASVSKMAVDSRSFNIRKENNSGIIIEDLLPGNHRIRIYKKAAGFNGNRYGGDRLQLIYNEIVFIKQGYHVDVVINRFGKVMLDEQKLPTVNFEDEDLPGYFPDNDETRMVISNRDLQQLKQSVSSANFETTKMAIAKQGIGQNVLTAVQIKEIVNLFSFENDKLNLAKYAYDYCIDTNRYFLVGDAFKFSSSKEELAAFLEKK